MIWSLLLGWHSTALLCPRWSTKKFATKKHPRSSEKVDFCGLTRNLEDILWDLWKSCTPATVIWQTNMQPDSFHRNFLSQWFGWEGFQNSDGGGSGLWSLSMMWLLWVGKSGYSCCNLVIDYSSVSSLNYFWSFVFAKSLQSHKRNAGFWDHSFSSMISLPIFNLEFIDSYKQQIKAAQPIPPLRDQTWVEALLAFLSYIVAWKSLFLSGILLALVGFPDGMERGDESDEIPSGWTTGVVRWTNGYEPVEKHMEKHNGSVGIGPWTICNWQIWGNGWKSMENQFVELHTPQR